MRQARKDPGVLRLPDPPRERVLLVPGGALQALLTRVGFLQGIGAGKYRYELVEKTRVLAVPRNAYIPPGLARVLLEKAPGRVPGHVWSETLELVPGVQRIPARLRAYSPGDRIVLETEEPRGPLKGATLEIDPKALD